MNFPKPLGWVFFLLMLAQRVGAAGSSGAPAVIEATHNVGGDVLVKASIPAGNNQVTLQTHGPGPGAWVPRVVSHLHGKGGNAVFAMPKLKTGETCRVWVEPQPLPNPFYAGIHNYPTLAGSSSELTPLVNAAAGLATPAAGTSTLASTNSSGTVTKSDIWQIEGHRLYFFNQYRGLQVIDITHPDSPSLLGQLDLPAAGEQMYVLDPNHVVLLAQDCTSDNGQTDVDVVNVSTGIPILTASLPVSGYLDDSHMVGNVLYLTCEALDVNSTNDAWGTEVSSFDCSNPNAPVARTSLWLSGYGDFVTAVDNYLFVAGGDPTNWWQSDLNCIDISAGDGSMYDVALVQTAGQITDASDINFSSGVLTTISETEDGTNWTPGTKLETFSFADPAAPAALGSLALASGEYLASATFDGSLVFISTENAADPFYVVDFSNPAAPQLAGQLNVPGGENYIYPLGSQLVAIGQSNWTNWQTTVSLFDVSDPANPELLSQVGVGDTNSWSEAVYDPEAFTVLPNAGLILVPFQSWIDDTETDGVQLIDLGAKSLTARGLIHQPQARRATLFENRVLSISGQDYLSVDISDQDAPSVTGSLTLGWPVNQVLVAGSYLLELGGTNFDDPDTVVRVTATATPSVLAAVWSLTNGPILGAVQRSNLLYVLEGSGQTSPLVDDPVLGPVMAQPLSRARNHSLRATVRDVAAAASPTLTLNIIDISQLPNLSILGQTTIDVSNLPAGNLQPLWPQPGVLTWVGSLQASWFEPLLAAPVTGNSLVIYPGPWFWNSGGVQLWTFDVSNSNAPALDSSIEVATNGWSDGGVAVTTNGLVYLSHSLWEFGPIPALPPVAGLPNLGASAASLRRPVPKHVAAVSTPALISANFSWKAGSCLDVVDLTVPTAPTLRPPIGIAGPLAGISHNGNVVYTLSSSWQIGQRLEALAYDGVSAYQVASLNLGADWNVTPVVWNETIFTARTSGEATTTNLLSSWTLTDQAKFARLGTTNLSASVESMATFDDLLGVQLGSTILLFNAAQPAALQSIGSGNAPGCLWPSLTGADGSVSAGLWSPLGDYGTFLIGTNP